MSKKKRTKFKMRKKMERDEAKSFLSSIYSKILGKYYVTMESDGAGNHMSIYVESSDDISEIIRSAPYHKCGWRVVFIKVRNGYINDKFNNGESFESINS